MKTPMQILSAVAGGTLLLPALVSANTTLLENPDFSSFEPWMAGSNVYLGGDWQAYVTDAYTVDDRVDPMGDGFVFTSWDDNESDKIETYVLQEYGAGPPASDTPTQFSTGDVIVFKGVARSTKQGTDTSDVVTRAFIKTLGYNEQGWAFQTKAEYSDFHEITSQEESFELSITYPDLAVDDSLQVIQLGLEITTEYDGESMDSGTIEFRDLEGYVEGGEPVLWMGYEVDADGYADTGEHMGMVYVEQAPWIYVQDLSRYVYMPEAGNTGAGTWMHVHP